MFEQQNPPTVNLKIWQQNLNTSLTAQEALLNNPEIANWDILVLQEPHINFLRNTRANHKWHVLYPTQHYTHPLQRSRAVILISSSLDTNTWKQLSFPSSDVVIIQLTGPYGKCSILNIYNDCEKQDTLTKLNDHLNRHISELQPTTDDHMLWMGDFNRHHPLCQEEIRNRHLYNYNAVQPLIDLIADYGMLQLLPIGLPTLQSSSTGNWTRPDNIFGTEQLLNVVTSCTTAPELRGPKTDHVPIQLILALEAPHASDTPKRNWREVDWEKFNTKLQALLTPFPPQPLASEAEFQESADRITRAILDTAEQHVPHTKPSPHARRWWTKRLTNLRHQVNQLSRQAYLMR
jgi:exonuclease III